MKGIMRYGLCLAVGLFVGRSFADEPQWRPARATPGPSGTMAAPATGQQGNSQATARNGQAIGLRAPVPIASTGERAFDPGVRPVAFRPVGLQTPAPLVRAKPDDGPRPLPVGPVKADPVSRFAPIGVPVRVEPALRTDQAKPEEIPTEPKVLSRPTPPTASAFGPGMVGGPIIEPGPEACMTDCGDCCTICDPCACCPPCMPCGDCWGCGTGCLPRAYCWLSAEYLLWGFRRPNIPPLVTSSPLGTADDVAGVLPGATVLFDGNTLNNAARSGLRLNGGFWCPWCPDFGLEANYFFLGRRSESFNFASGGEKIARPFFDVVNNQNFRQPVNFAGLRNDSSARVDFDNSLWGVGGNVRQKFWCCGWGHLDLLYGYRHVQYEENLAITEYLFNGAGNPQTIQDRFETRNRFHGFDMGFDAECRLCWRFWLGCKAKVALGNMHQVVGINGYTNPVTFGGTDLGNGGLLALPTNIGNYSRNRFAVIPEMNLKLGMDITQCCRIWVGYDFLYLSDVVRAGDQVDLRVNTTFRPQNTGVLPTGPRQPAVLFQSSSFWAQGVNFGLECRY